MHTHETLVHFYRYFIAVSKIFILHFTLLLVDVLILLSLTCF